jgi:hypothetical protein
MQMTAQRTMVGKPMREADDSSIWSEAEEGEWRDKVCR